ncbi:TRAP transporter solute receptor, TAXI family precursor [Thioalkalivibrio nitratireducens DSM 14787]|uniref:TRAP transporter solute receptor, TAXI family n=1 Tax=Thioalkalivibrio nitratireducens (strain DSM 14787 / UNIQEM 213 / ALEN2) TaxID=1255043 RepID=L0E0S3_THIND|nr:TAXI family TRAP transporter solute-binding subunit [Thioalkalivibrio nitratireducens]AGA35419.1 TRAP transporter solute receptor, TAXI family precursor [Thioalkalivibrio nitratireducens DSM 14787]
MKHRFMGWLVIGLTAIAMAGTGALAQERSDWPGSVKIGTASQGGTYFIYGAGWGNRVQEQLGVNTTAEVTGGPAQNLVLVHSGELQFGMTTMGPARDAWDGKLEMAPGLETRNVRAMFPMYMTPFQVVALQRSGIDSISDLRGKRVGVGPRGGTASVYWPRFFQDLGVNVRLQYGGASDLAGQLQDGLIDAFAFAAGVPISAFSQLEAQQSVNIFSFTDAELDVVTANNPVSPVVIPGGTYRSVPGDQTTVAMWNYAIAHKDMPESLVQRIMEVVLDDNERMVRIHRSATETLPENYTTNSFMWFHPGAVCYLQAKGFEVDERLIPPEMAGCH